MPKGYWKEILMVVQLYMEYNATSVVRRGSDCRGPMVVRRENMRPVCVLTQHPARLHAVRRPRGRASDICDLARVARVSWRRIA